MMHNGLKYEVWTGYGDGKTATFRNLEQAQAFLDGIKGFYPNAFIYDTTEGKNI